MHIAIIMDGNGRWAARRRLPRTAGHRAGATAVNTVVEAAARRRVSTLTLYAFSAGNWHRPEGEVSALFALFKRHLLTQTRRCLEQSIRINVIGRRDRLNAELHELIERSEQETAQCDGMRLRLAIDYSAQHSLVETCRRLRRQDEIDRSRFVERLAEVDHAALPAPEVDLLIRTGGEKRLSDFLLWECAYAELHFVDCLWPDFDERAFDEALQEYARRERRFGAIQEDQCVRSSHG
ncbi:MAG TPA: polyprenyl diphosphate synthase [Steroidobacteraceae bacterium]|jgi:undecaprenyl diphosphate synthase|nr:polyprenyl diphosphate synthase [Steroidobacteraceae bacterium]